jgi:hypothetical protein
MELGKGKRFRTFLRIIKNVVDLQLHDAEAAAKAVIVFGHQAAGWLGTDVTAWQSRALVLNVGVPAHVSKWLWRHRRSADVRGLLRVASAWEHVEKACGQSLSQLGVREAVAAATIVDYDSYESVEFAMEANSHGVSPRNFERWEPKWISTVAARKADSLPAVDLVVNGYRFFKVAHDDPRGVFLGEHTNCCQHPGSAGSSCAWHGVKSQYGGFYAVERCGMIVAQSWAWRPKERVHCSDSPRDVKRPGDVVVFDNIEVLSHDYHEGVEAAYRAGAAAILGRLGVSEVHVGLGYNTMAWVSALPKCRAASTPKGVYTDARVQVALDTI